MDKKTKDGFWFGILLSYFVVFTILTFVAIAIAVGMDNGAQWIMIMYLLGDGIAFVIGICVAHLK